MNLKTTSCWTAIDFKKKLSVAVVTFLLTVLNSFAQTFTGTGGTILSTDTSRFNIAVSGLPTVINNSFGLISLTLNITHPHDRDIDCFLAAPNGQFIEITTDNGGATGANYVNTVFRDDATVSIVVATGPCTGTFYPEGFLSDVNRGQNPNGTWQLRIRDDTQDASNGTLNSWSITFGNNPPPGTSESNLPILMINTGGQTIPDSPKIICDMGLIDNGLGNRNHTSDPFNAYTGKIAIEIRGSSSQQFPKKNYGFHTVDQTGLVDSDAVLLGMPIEHKWDLYASYTDKSLIHNNITYQLGNEMGHWAARCRYVDMYINGQYWGVYVLMEAIKRDHNRVNIQHLYADENTYPSITGGYIFKIDKTTGGAEPSWYSGYLPVNHPNGQQILYQVDYPSADSLTTQQLAYIKSYVDSFENAAFGVNFMDSILGFRNFITTRSFIDFFISNEISKNVDGYRISTYLYKDSLKKIHAGPLWDFDIAYGNANYCSGFDTTGWAYLFPCTTDGFQPPAYWQKFMTDSNFTNELRCRWDYLRQNVLSLPHLYSIIDSIATYIDESQRNNFRRWPILGIYVWPNVAPYPTTYAGEVANLKQWLSTRLAWMDANLPGHCNCSLAVSVQNVSCHNACDGQAMGLGTSPYPVTYTWDNGAPSDTLNYLCPGPYVLTLEDAIGCIRTSTVNITEPDVLTASIAAQSNIACGGALGSATVSVTGGTSAYSYSWSPSGGSTATASGLAAGTYTCSITDAHGCTTSQTVTITQSSMLSSSVASQTNVTCNGLSNGSATVSASGGSSVYTYSWSPSGGTNATGIGLIAGNYTCSISDGAGCTATQAVAITEPQILLASLNSHTDVTCNGALNGAASVLVSGGSLPYSYAWSPSGGITANALGLSGGTYTCSITDGHGCTTSQVAIITEPIALSAALSSQTNVTCHGAANGSAAVSVTGGTPVYTYLWSPSGQTNASVAGLSGGTYTVTITDSHSCTTSQTAIIAEPTALSGQTSSTAASCGQTNGSVSLTTSGGTPGYTYLWTPGGETSNSIAGLTAGIYSVTVTDSHGCTIFLSETVTNAGAPVIQTNINSTVSCHGGGNGIATVNVVSGSNPYTYLWSPSAQTTTTAINLSAQTYIVTVTDANGCETNQEVIMTEPDALSVSISSQTAVSCFGTSTGSATVTVSGGTASYIYLWSPMGGTNATAIGLPAGTYTCTISDANSCSTSQAVTIIGPSALSASISFQANANCFGEANGSATVSVSGGTAGYSYSWAPFGGTSQTGIGFSAGTYTCTVTDANSCTTTQTVIINQPPLLVSTLVSVTNVNCFGNDNGSATVSVTGGTPGYIYAWGPSGGNAATEIGLTVGSYTCTITDENGCTSVQEATISEPSQIVISTSATDATCTGCTDGTASATVNGGIPSYTYSWDTSPVQTTATAINLAPGMYHVCVTDINSCTVCDSVQVMDATLGMNNISNQSHLLQVYPNPSNGSFTIELNKWKINSIELMDMAGRLIERKENLSASTVHLSSPGLASGLYLLKVYSGGNVMLKKISILN